MSNPASNSKLDQSELVEALRRLRARFLEFRGRL